MFLAQSPTAAASLSTSNIGVSTPSTVILVNGTVSGTVIVVPTPVVFSSPEATYLIAAAFPSSVPPLYLLGSSLSVLTLILSVIIPTEPVPVTLIVP